jgi:hypothetical protein
MFNVTNWLLGQALFGGPDSRRSDAYSPNAAGAFQGAMPRPFGRQAYSDAKRAALIDALENGAASEPPGLVATPDAGPPTVTGGQAVQASLYQRQPYGLPPPPRPQRPFSEDYPLSYSLNPFPWLWGGLTDRQGRLRYDSERRALEAKYVVGRRYANGPDVGLENHEVLDVLKQLGITPRFLPTNQMPRLDPQEEPLGGATVVQENTWPRSWIEGRFRPREVSIDANLDPRSQDIVARHELGHVLRHLTRQSMNDDAWRELRTLFNTMNNPDRTPDGLNARPGSVFTPERLGYPTRSAFAGLNPAEDEYFAEALRAYMTDPNFVKSVAPNFAAAVRAAVNSHPRLRRVIQFNSLKFPTYAGFGQSPDQQQTG